MTDFEEWIDEIEDRRSESWSDEYEWSILSEELEDYMKDKVVVERADLEFLIDTLDTNWIEPFEEIYWEPNKQQEQEQQEDYNKFEKIKNKYEGLK